MSLVSLYDEASLWMTPGAYEDGKLFSELPTDGSGDFTFSRGSNLSATRVGPTGLIEKGRENLFKHSNDFNQSVWIHSGTITSGQSGYDGTNNAWKFENPSITSSIYQPNTNSGVQTISAYFKKNATYGVRFYAFGSSNANTWFDLNNGVVVAQNNTIDASVEPVGTDWFRCSMTINQTNSRCDFYVTNNAQVQVLGHFTIQDAQLEIGLAATEVITTGATTGKAGLLENEPRLDYSGGASCPSLLLEPSRSNLVVNSEYINNSASGWSTFFDTNITNNAATSPDGAHNATEVACPIGGSARIDSVNSGVAVGTYTYTFYAKGNVSSLYLNAYEDATGTTLSSTSIGALINDSNWSRIDVTFTTTAISTIRMIINSLLSGESFYIYGAQLELGSYPTSYIPTYGTSQTRSIDGGSNFQIDNLKNNGFFGNTYTLFYEFDNLNFGASSQQFNYLFDDNGSLTMYVYGTTLTILTESGPRYTLFTNGFTNVKSGKFLVKYDGSDIKIFKDGSLYQTYSDPTSSWSIPKLIRLYTSTATASISYKQVLTFPTALNDSECIALTKLD